jgi:hypothetical protein
VALFAEQFKEMLETRCGRGLLRCLYILEKQVHATPPTCDVMTISSGVLTELQHNSMRLLAPAARFVMHLRQAIEAKAKKEAERKARKEAERREREAAKAKKAAEKAADGKADENKADSGHLEPKPADGDAAAGAAMSSIRVQIFHCYGRLQHSNLSYVQHVPHDNLLLLLQTPWARLMGMPPVQ